MKNDIKLCSGRVVALRELRQSSTYEGLLNGLPTKERNQKLVSQLLEQHRHQRYEVAPLLIKAFEREIALPDDEVYPFGTPAALPSVTCVGRFESLDPTTPHSGDASGLTVIWFQDHFQYPPPPEILAQLESIKWESHAGNFDY
jgi:hypothetical protein